MFVRDSKFEIRSVKTTSDESLSVTCWTGYGGATIDVVSMANGT